MGKGRTTGRAGSGKPSRPGKSGRPVGSRSGSRGKPGPRQKDGTGRSSGRKPHAVSDKPDYSHEAASFLRQAEAGTRQAVSDEDASLMVRLGDILRQANRPLGMDELLRISKLPRRSKKHLEYLLYGMQEQGLALKGPTGWSSPARLRYVEGTLSVQRGGMGFVSAADRRTRDVFIPPPAMNGAWHGDRVRALVLPGRRGPSPEGRIIAVLERADRELAAEALRRQKDGAWTCAPQDQRIQALFIADVTALENEVHEGDLLLLRPAEQLGPNLWQAVATFNLEREENPAAQERLVKSRHGIPVCFPNAVLDEARAFPPDPGEKDYDNRQRLESCCFVTIDGRQARDFDDAVQVERLADGYRLRVAIADVSHYVDQGSDLDMEARLRGNSYYFPLSVEPMLPEALSNGLCSLRPNVPRLVMVADMLFSGSGERTSAEFYPAVIVSKARLTYGQIERALLLEEKEEQERIAPVLPMLQTAMELARLAMAMRKKRGSLDFDIPEPEVLFDEAGAVIGLVPRNRHFGHRLIEEFMIAANEAVAEFLQNRGEGTLYRVHQPPDPEKLSTLVRYLSQSGLAAGSKALFQLQRKKGSLPSIKELSALLDELHGKSQEYTVNRLLLRAMMQARYEPDNEGHFGLGSACYCHFTSPIRRYADLVVHRSLKHALGVYAPAGGAAEGGASFRPYTRSRLEAIAEQINACERTAAEAEREIYKRLAILLLKDRVGECFDGVISGLADFGIFVELPSVMAEGMVSLSDLTDDFYQYLPEKQEMRGTGTGRVFRLGQAVSVKLTDVHLGRLEANLIFAKNRTGRKQTPGPAE